MPNASSSSSGRNWAVDGFEGSRKRATSVAQAPSPGETKSPNSRCWQCVLRYSAGRLDSNCARQGELGPPHAPRKS